MHSLCMQRRAWNRAWAEGACGSNPGAARQPPTRPQQPCVGSALQDSESCRTGVCSSLPDLHPGWGAGESRRDHTALWGSHPPPPPPHPCPGLQALPREQAPGGQPRISTDRAQPQEGTTTCCTRDWTLHRPPRCAEPHGRVKGRERCHGHGGGVRGRGLHCGHLQRFWDWGTAGWHEPTSAKALDEFLLRFPCPFTPRPQLQ